jgi:hypothetical protein
VIEKSYLFAAVTSGLLLLFVVPLLRYPSLSPTEIASMVTLTVISVAIAGLVAESYSMIKRGPSEQISLANAKKYFKCFTCSLLFLAIVAPSIRTAVQSAGLLDVATIAVLLVLSLALGGLTAEGFFGLFSKSRTRVNVSGNDGGLNAGGAHKQSADVRRFENTDSHVDSRLNALVQTLETKIEDLEEKVASAIHEVGLTSQPNNNSITSNQDGKENISSSQIEQKLPPHNHQSQSQAKVVDVLLGKAKVGGK